MITNELELYSLFLFLQLKLNVWLEFLNNTIFNVKEQISRLVTKKERGITKSKNIFHLVYIISLYFIGFYWCLLFCSSSWRGVQDVSFISSWDVKKAKNECSWVEKADVLKFWRTKGRFSRRRRWDSASLWFKKGKYQKKICIWMAKLFQRSQVAEVEKWKTMQILVKNSNS